MKYRVTIMSRVNSYDRYRLVFENYYCTYEGALEKARQWLSDKNRSKQYNVVIEEN